jgi:TctA family transporter
MIEENFRRSLVLSQGDVAIFVEHPISACFIGAGVLLIAGKIFFAMRARSKARTGGSQTGSLSPLNDAGLRAQVSQIEGQE